MKEQRKSNKGTEEKDTNGGEGKKNTWSNGSGPEKKKKELSNREGTEENEKEKMTSLMFIESHCIFI